MLSAVVLPLCTLCCSDQGADNNCADDVVPEIPAIPRDVHRVAQFRLDDRRISVLEEGELTSVRTAIASLSAADSEAVERIPRPRQFFNDSCFVLTGQSVTQCSAGFKEPCETTPLELGRPSLDGVAGGLQLELRSAGRYVAATPPTPPWSGGPITLTVAAATAEPSFPAFDREIEPPQELALIEPVPQQALGDTPLSVTWQPPQGDDQSYIEINLSVDRVGDNDKVVCLAVDDGCHQIPAEALQWIRSGTATDDRFRLSVSRVRETVLALDPQHAVEIKLVSRLEFPLAR